MIENENATAEWASAMILKNLKRKFKKIEVLQKEQNIPTIIIYLFFQKYNGPHLTGPTSVLGPYYIFRISYYSYIIFKSIKNLFIQKHVLGTKYT